MIDPGLRPDELYALEEADLDLDARTLRVERSLSDDGERIDSPKGGIARDIDLSNEAVRVLRAHLNRRREETLRRKSWRELPRPLFCSTAGTYADPSGVREAFRRVCVQAGLVEKHPGAEGEKPRTSPRFTPHGLRHTYAALHLQHGTDVYYVSRMLGHADIAMTVGTYGAWLKPNRRAAVDALDRTPAIPARHEPPEGVHAMTPHASARALILLTGRYLVFPPVSKHDGHWSFNLRAPAAKWVAVNRFASSEDCEAYRFPYLDRMRAAVVRQDHSSNPITGMGRAVVEAKSQAVCDQR